MGKMSRRAKVNKICRYLENNSKNKEEYLYNLEKFLGDKYKELTIASLDDEQLDTLLDKFYNGQVSYSCGRCFTSFTLTYSANVDKLVCPRCSRDALVKNFPLGSCSLCNKSVYNDGPMYYDSANEDLYIFCSDSCRSLWYKQFCKDKYAKNRSNT